MKPIKIKFLPSDFEGNTYENINDCAISRAAKRHFKHKLVATGGFDVSLYLYKGKSQIDYLIDGEFYDGQFNEIKESFKNNPKAKHFITLKLIMK